MRIAVYHNLSSGGAKRALQEEMRRLALRHQVDVYTLSTADHDFADIRPYASRHEVYAFQPTALLRSPFGRANQAIRIADLLRLRQLARRIASDIRRARYDIVFVHPCMYEIAPSILRYLSPTPTVYFCQEPPRLIYETMPDRPYSAVAGHRVALNRLDPLPRAYLSVLSAGDNAATRSASRVLVNSEFVRASIQPIYNLDACVSYLGVDADWAQPDGGAREPFVLSVGSLTPLKGFDFLILALAQITPARRPPLIIASNFQNPPERAYLEDLALRHDVALKLAGSISDAELASLYRRARVVAYAPIREPFGLVTLEAMASATPVVAVAEGGIPETVVHESTGILTPRNAGDFAAALLRVYEDQAMASRLGTAGRQHVLRHWTWEQATARLEEHFVATITGATADVASPSDSRMRASS